MRHAPRERISLSEADKSVVIIIVFVTTTMNVQIYDVYRMNLFVLFV